MTPFLIALFLLVLQGRAAAADPIPVEYQVKAAFLYNFAKFVEWPKASFPASGSAITLCVLREDPFADAAFIVTGKKVGDRFLLVKRLDAIREARGCQIIFLGDREAEHLPAIANVVRGEGVLLVGETEGLAGRGAMINFYMEDRKVRFEINPEAARASGLRISSNLLKLGRIVASDSSSGEKR